MSKYGHMVNDIREIFKAPSPDTFLDKLLAHMNDVSEKYQGLMLAHKEPDAAMNCFFVGYLSISLMLSATEGSQLSPEKKLFYIDTVVRLIEAQLMKNLETPDETGKKAN